MQAKDKEDVLFEQLAGFINDAREEYNFGIYEIMGILDIIKMDLYQELTYGDNLKMSNKYNLR